MKLFQIWVRTKEGWQMASNEKMQEQQAFSFCRQFKTAGNIQEYTFCEVGEAPCW